MQGLILFAHGARDARWAEPFKQLHKLCAQRAPQTPIALAYLEIMQPDLPTAAQQLIAQGCLTITVVPVFLGQGGHVRQDLPALLATLRSTYPAISFDCVGAVGEDAAVLSAMADYCVRLSVAG